MAHFIDFRVGQLKVGGIGTSSGVFVGQNLQYGWRSSAKENYSGGTVTGDGNTVSITRGEIVDPDYLDTWIQKPLPFTQTEAPSPALIQAWAQHRRGLRRRGRGSRQAAAEDSHPAHED